MHPQDFLGKLVHVEIDRPLGSRHPTYDYVYPLNYGFLPGTQSGDGEDLDAYILGIAEPIQTFEGRCIAVIHRLNDNDDKLVIVPDGADFSDDQIREATLFQEQFFESIVIRD